MHRTSLLTLTSLLSALGLVAGACGGSEASDGAVEGAPAGAPTVVVSTSILGDVVSNLVGDLATVEVIMPRGASPHEFQASAQQAAAMREGDALIVSGAGFEEGLLDTIEAATADGVPTYAAIDAVSTLDVTRVDGRHETDEGRVDPHFFTDPSRMADAAIGIAEFLVEQVPAFDDAALRAQALAYGDELARLDGEVERIVAPIPVDQRKLVTNHEVFSYFADRYAFDVLGVVVPGGGTAAEPSAGDLADLAEVIERAQVPAIFVDTSSPQKLADALAAEVGEVQVVELFSESLGPEGSEGATFVGMARTNAQRIADALSP